MDKFARSMHNMSGYSFTLNSVDQSGDFDILGLSGSFTKLKLNKNHRHSISTNASSSKSIKSKLSFKHSLQMQKDNKDKDRSESGDKSTRPSSASYSFGQRTSYQFQNLRGGMNRNKMGNEGSKEFYN